MSDEAVTVDAAAVVAGDAPAETTGSAAPVEAPAAAAPEAPAEKPAAVAEPLPERVKKIREATERVREESRMRREYEARIKELEERASALDMLDKDPDEALKRLGKSFDAVAKAKLAKMGMAKKAAEIPEEIRAELDALRTQLEESRAAQVEAEAAKLRHQMQSEITVELRKEAQYELLNAEFGPSAPAKVFELIQRHYQRTEEAGEPEVLTPEKAASMLEAALEQQFARWANTQKARSKLGMTSAPERGAGEKAATAMAPSLTNQLASPATPGPEVSVRRRPTADSGIERILGKR